MAMSFGGSFKMGSPSSMEPFVRRSNIGRKICLARSPNVEISRLGGYERTGVSYLRVRRRRSEHAPKMTMDLI